MGGFYEGMKGALTPGFRNDFWDTYQTVRSARPFQALGMVIGHGDLREVLFSAGLFGVAGYLGKRGDIHGAVADAWGRAADIHEADRRGRY